MSTFNYFSLSSSDISRMVHFLPSNAYISSTQNEDGFFDVTVTLTEITYPDPATLDI